MRKILIIILVLVAVPLYVYNAYILLYGSINGDSGHDIPLLSDDVNRFPVNSILSAFDSVKFTKHGRSPFIPSAIIEKTIAAGTSVPVRKTEMPKHETVMPKISVNGIMWNPEKPLAMLEFADGTSAVVKAGQIIGDITVKKIEKTWVTVVFGKKEFRIDR